MNDNLPGDMFRRMELARQLRRLADLVEDVPGLTPAVGRTPWIEFHVASEDEVNTVARRIGQFPQQFKDQYFVDLDAVELRVRWTHTLPAEPEISDTDPLGLAYTRSADDAADPTPTGPREPLHTGGMTESGLVDETVGEGRTYRECCGIGPISTHNWGCQDGNRPVDETGGYWSPRASDGPLHFVGDVGSSTLCGKDPAMLPAGEGYTSGRDGVTCSTCRDVLIGLPS